MGFAHIQKSSRLQDTAADASITFGAPGAGKYNIITGIEVESSAAATITIQSQASTNLWQTGITADETSFIAWNDYNAIRGAENQAVVIAVSAGNYTVNARGYVTP